MKLSNDRIFPNLNQTVASYSPITLFVSFRKIKQKDFTNHLKVPTTFAQAETIGIIHHEVRHYLDHISTLWGIRHLDLLYKALNARLSLDETRFHMIIKYKKFERELHFAEYYHELNRTVEYRTVEDIWEYEITTGLRFSDSGYSNDDYPVLLVKFFAPKIGAFSRVPVSIASLLETNATYQEVEARSNFVTSLSGQNAVREQDKLNKWAFTKLVYNCDLTLYNVAVHLTATILNLTDVRIAFQISSAVATLALNLPAKYVVGLPINMPELIALGDRPKAMLNNGEHGFIFYVLLKNYRDRFFQNGTYSLAELLESNNLPNETDLTVAVLSEFSDYEQRFNLETLSDYFKHIFNKGYQLLQERGIDGTRKKISAVIASKELRPEIQFSDTQIKSGLENFPQLINNGVLKNLNAHDYHKFVEIVDERMTDFYEIRGI